MLAIKDKIYSKDGMAIKYIQRTTDNYVIETTYVNHYKKHIICFSSQIGCNVGCQICYSGICSKFYRNLTAQEMYDQVINIIYDLKLDDKPILFSCMGVGEPLLNYRNVIDAFKMLYHDFPNDKYALATTGIKPNLILQLATDLKQIKNFKLTISLHATKDSIRKKIIPNIVSINELISIGKKYEEISNHPLEWNYVLLNNINDTEKDALELINLLGKDAFVKINQYNPVELSTFRGSNEERVNKFIATLGENIKHEYYQTNGADILGACGQMVCKKNQEVMNDTK